MNLQEHLLTCLNEECVEVGKDVSKSLRFGLDDRNVLDPTGPTNRERLVNELNDLAAVIQMLTAEGIIPDDWLDIGKISDKKVKVWKFVKYATEVGALQ